jgi:predicted aldo/keto reductase-like oxidoreductase
MKRRTFMSAMAASAASMAIAPSWSSLLAAGRTLPKRPLGKTGLELSVIGFGGVVARGTPHEGVERVVDASLDLGINFYDTAASYGNSEEMMAPVLKSRRQNIILATKTRERTAEGARAEFEKSCETFGTDYFDMFLVHAIQHIDRDIEPAFGPGGAMEYLLERKEAGQIRNLGFSAHSTEAALMALDNYPFDFFYLPVSYVSYYKGNFGPAVLAKAKEMDVPVVSLKAMARQNWPAGFPREDRPEKCWYEPIEDLEEASLALRWALSQEQLVSVLPPGNEEYYRRTLALSEDLSPITPEETERLRAMAMADAMNPLFPR